MSIDPHTQVKRQIEDHKLAYKRRGADLSTALPAKAKAFFSRAQWKGLSKRKQELREHQATKHQALITTIQDSITEHGVKITPREALHKYYLNPLMGKTKAFIAKIYKEEAPKRIYDPLLKSMPKPIREKILRQSETDRLNARNLVNIAVRVGEFLQKEIDTIFPGITAEERNTIVAEMHGKFYKPEAKMSGAESTLKYLGQGAYNTSVLLTLMGLSAIAGVLAMEAGGEKYLSKHVSEAVEIIQLEQMSTPSRIGSGTAALDEVRPITPANNNPIMEVINHTADENHYPQFIYFSGYIPTKDDLTLSEKLSLNSGIKNVEADMTLRILPIHGIEIANRLAHFTNQSSLYQATGLPNVLGVLDEETFGWKKGEVILLPIAPGYEVASEIPKLKLISGNHYRVTDDVDHSKPIDIPLVHSPETTMQDVEILEKPFFDKYTDWETKIRAELKENKDDANKVEEIIKKYLAGPNGDDGMIYIMPSSDSNLNKFLKDLSPLEKRELMIGYCSHSSAMVYGLGADLYPSAVIAGYANARLEYKYNREGREFIGKEAHAKPLMRIGNKVISPESTSGGYERPFLGASLRTEDMESINTVKENYRTSTGEDRIQAIQEMRRELISSMTLAQNDNDRPSQGFSF